ncbi:uncharacterized protein LOC113540598 [Pangasianodon hypophthalmus]|uniref:uncharacterized protein LOC113540598 n=1 Tax=Pangasianodon hypophthalmus TaxID=310915 RepID=UPI0023076704|nr:uncharacterized protein LOC113540598 [Pangasianodon hypophthalmus]
MDHVSTLLMLIAPCSVLCGHVPAPVNLTMESHHFIHLLSWQAGPGSPAGLNYTVIFRSYSEGWKMVDRCEAVRDPLRCNLTDVFSDLEKTYYINVTAVSGNETSKPRSYSLFTPVSDTEPELPSLRVSACNDSLCVYLQSPSERLEAVYKKFPYTLNVTNEKGVQFLQNTIGLKTVDLKVVPGLQYCVSVSIRNRSTANKPPVCASKPAAVNNMDAVISVFLCLLALVTVMIVGLLLLKRSMKIHQPLVLSSFKPPYKVVLLRWPTVEFVKCVSLEPNIYKDVQVSEEVDREKEDEEVAYEGRRGCEEISEESRSSLPSSPESQYEHPCNPDTKTHTHVPGTFLKEHTAPDKITRHWEATTPQTTSQTLTAHLLPLKTPIQELKKNDLALLRHKRGDELREEEEEEEEEEEVEEEEEEEDSDNVNFFSLILGGQNSEQQEEKMENVKKVQPEVPLFVLQPPKPAMDIQPTYTENTTKRISYSEEEEEEDMEEEEAFSGYMIRS